jgi:hypothetical protein
MPLLVLATVATIIAEPRPPLLGVRPPLRDSRNQPLAHGDPEQNHLNRRHSAPTWTCPDFVATGEGYCDRQ